MKTIDCTGDVVAGDVITWTEAVFGGSHRSPSYLGERQVTAKVVRDSYGAGRQQHTFMLRVIRSEGYEPVEAGKRIRRKGRNIYRNGTTRELWADEALRQTVAGEKHMRGDQARQVRDRRRLESCGLVQK